jgi:hypothetical protein
MLVALVVWRKRRRASVADDSPLETSAERNVTPSLCANSRPFERSMAHPDLLST